MTDLPSYGLVQRFMHEAGFDVPDPDKEPAFPSSKYMKLASRLIQYGMDCELDACCEWMTRMGYWGDDGKAIPALRAARRPKPLSLKEQALDELHISFDRGYLKEGAADTIRRALEQLPE
jgi:hypothetical protein